VRLGAGPEQREKQLLRGSLGKVLFQITDALGGWGTAAGPSSESKHSDPA